MGLIEGAAGNLLLEKLYDLRRKKALDKMNKKTIEVIIKYLEYRSRNPEEKDEQIDVEKALLNVIKFYQ